MREAVTRTILQPGNCFGGKNKPFCLVLIENTSEETIVESLKVNNDTDFKAIYPALPKQSDKQLSCTFKDLIIGPNESKLFVLFRQDLTPD